MADKSKIEWTDATWNPIRGCSVVSEGCRNCYAMQVAARFNKPGQAYEGLAYRNESGAHWTGEVRLIEEHLRDPLRWTRPRRIFVNSMSDLFHESIPDDWIDTIFTVMALSPRHVFQVLTKRPQRMLQFTGALTGDRLLKTAFECGLLTPTVKHVEAYAGVISGEAWPLPNVWLGVSVEDQNTADERIPLLMETPAAVRWISAEPLLGLIDLESVPTMEGSIDWVVVGGESGPQARPTHPDWARSLRDQCVAAGVPFFFKQWGEFIATAHGIGPAPKGGRDQNISTSAGLMVNVRVGKKAAGRLLDGREWNEYPAIAEVRA